VSEEAESEEEEEEVVVVVVSAVSSSSGSRILGGEASRRDLRGWLHITIENKWVSLAPQ
jgi:hypothetical protein